jgi:uncharacterized heparinase superfamily protein
VAWHPYPLSLRLASWLAHAEYLCQGADVAFTDAFHRALHRQARHLERVWERDVGGNHLIKNLKAAITCARCLPGHEETQAGALSALEHEIGRQVLADGCHYERSPSYHYQVLGDLEDLAALFGEPPAFLAEAIARMRPAAAFFVMAPGMLAQFNDGTTDGPPVPPEGPVLSALPDAGYWRLRAGTACLMVDCGPCCPDDLPAHAHADTLSFEMFDGGDPLVVNCGTYAYQDAVWRNRFRGTAFHSTLSVDDGDSAEVYGGFRLGRRPGRFDVTCAEGRFSGEFDGWGRLGLSHRRTLRLEEGRLEGLDEVIALHPGSSHALTARFHLHPSVTAQPDGDGIVVSTAGGVVWRFAAPGLAVSLAESRYSPRFHEMEPTRCIRVDARLTGGKAALPWRFYRP